MKHLLARILQNIYLSFAFRTLLLGLLIYLRVIHPRFTTSWAIPARYIDALLFFFTLVLVFYLVRVSLAALYRKRRNLERTAVDNFIIGINQIGSIAGFLAFLGGLLIVFNIELKEALTAVSIVAAAIAILSKDYISQMINGMILMFSDQISLHDQIKVGEHKGKVIDLNLLNLHLLNDDGDLLLIPNTTVLSDKVLNYSKRSVKKISIDFEMGYPTLEDIPELEAYLINALTSYQASIRPDAYYLRVFEIKKDALSLKFQYILKEDAPREVEMEIRRLTVRALVSYVKRSQDSSSMMSDREA